VGRWIGAPARETTAGEQQAARRTQLGAGRDKKRGMMTVGDVGRPSKRCWPRPIPPPILWLHSPCRLDKGRKHGHVMAPLRFVRLPPVDVRLNRDQTRRPTQVNWPHVGRCKPHNPALPHMVILVSRDLVLIIQTSQSSLQCHPGRERSMIAAWAVRCSSS
jgi:hypothetical protein